MTSEQLGIVAVFVFVVAAIIVVQINLWHEGRSERKDAERRNHARRLK